ncbi:primosome assembly protein PriA [Nakamurella sp. YIM 132084]|uniref:Probable replication restart protein PriA n=1 Tax=Nakamurella leprariae TaxID=2803911 RepID=A0A939C239_9ACTN|nr:primosome assembly protein PriA [Nakamurella leprariae]
MPVARVAVDVSLAHLNRPFDYLVRAEDADTAVPGARVRVRFAGRLVAGFVLDRLAESDHDGRLGWLDRVVSPEPVLSAEVAALCRAVADRYAGSLADVLRLAVPPRHARVEAETPPSPAADPCDDETPAPDPTATLPPAGTGWAWYPRGPAFLDAVRAGRSARAVWTAGPGESWPARLAEAAAAAHRAGRGALLVVPDARDLSRLADALGAVLPAGEFRVLAADLGPAERYRRYLAVRRGAVRVVAGTRAAVFAPVRDLGLVAVFDDGDDLLAEPRAPYPHAREVAMLRSAATGSALLLGGSGRSVVAQSLLDAGWAQAITATRAAVRERAPRIEAAGDDRAVGADSAAARARLTPAAFAAARAALQDDRPVLVQVPRRGYVPALACARCRRPSRCRRCAGPLAMVGAGRPPQCRWCGVADPAVRCAACGSSAVRAVVAGARRTAEELGRAFPGVEVITSAGNAVRDRVAAAAALVIATPGAEPVPDGPGYGAALLLDGAALLGRPDLGAAQEALRRWLTAAAMVRPATDGGRVVVGADSALPTVQALIRWDPAGQAEAELAAARELQLPPAVAMVSLDGPESAVVTAMTQLELPDGADALGPVPLGDLPGGSGRRGGSAAADDPDDPAARVLLRVPLPGRRALLSAVRAWSAARSARRDAAPVRVQVDPTELV